MSGTQTIALVGECMIELQGEPFGLMRQSFGGDTLNTAIYLARLGAIRGIRVSYATALGTDSYSDGMLERWQAEGISTELVRRLPDRVPGLYAIKLGEDGEREFTYWRDNSAAKYYFDERLTPLEAQASGFSALYFSGISLAILSPAARDRLLACAATVQGHGGKVVFDNNYRPRLWATPEEARESFDRAYRLADIALVTLDDETRLRGDWPAEHALRRCLELPSPEIVVKRGAASTWFRAEDRLGEVPTRAVARVADTTAAGDSFAAAYLAERLKGASAAESVLAGNVLASEVVQHQGAIIPIASMPESTSGPASAV